MLPSVDYYIDSCINSNKYVEDGSVDLFFNDPPYFISGSSTNKATDSTSGLRNEWDRQWKNEKEFYEWTDVWMSLMYSQMKETGSGYVCISWQHSGKFHELLRNNKFKIRNRITWKRDKGRGALNNWKSMHEDIWFFTKSNHYTFNVSDVMEIKNVVAPYKDKSGNPKGWFVDEDGNNVRYTYPGNLWTEFTVPFWSMHEVRSYAKTKRTPKNKYPKHNTQKPKDLVKKCILASSNKGDTVVDYFVGSGTTAIASFEVGRNSIVFDISETCIGMLKQRLKSEVSFNLF
jgi:site-specific DNA-methyltransferase (adenine-specific)